MTSGGKIHARAGYKWILTLLFAFAISLLNSTEARADDRCVLDYGGVIDGLVTPNPPAQLQIDGNCIIRKVSPAGRITTVAGTAPTGGGATTHCGYAGDGHPATTALLLDPAGVAATSDGGLSPIGPASDDPFLSSDGVTSLSGLDPPLAVCRYRSHLDVIRESPGVLGA